jgi:hypothetical protein
VGQDSTAGKLIWGMKEANYKKLCEEAKKPFSEQTGVLALRTRTREGEKVPLHYVNARNNLKALLAGIEKYRADRKAKNSKLNSN